jgi:hypothetical protein
MQAVKFVEQRYRIYPLFEAMLIGMMSFLVISVSTYFIYHYSLSAQTGEIKEGLLRTAKVVSSFIDPDVHRTFTDPAQQQSDTYKNAIKPLESALAVDPSIKYLYTAILKNDKVYFILDATPSGDVDEDGLEDKAFIMDHYVEAPADIIRALKNQEIVISNEPYTDRWGQFLSGYIPLFDSNKEFVGVLGIDIQASAYFARLEPIKRATIRTMVMGFFISFLIASVVWLTRNFGLKVNARRNAVTQYLIKQQQLEQDKT